MSVVSVIMAAYNVRPYVAEAVRSVLQQSLQDIELIVVDDGSTDGTDRALSAIRDPRMRVIRTENRGVCHARNRALSEATSPYVAVMDSDDLSHPLRLERQCHFLDDSPSLAGVGCWVWLMTPRGRLVYQDRVVTGERRVLAELYRNGGGVYPATCVMRTELVRKTGGYRAAVPVSEDLDLLLRLTAFGGLDNVPESLYSYRLNSQSLTFSSKARRDHYARVALGLWNERCQTGADSLDRGEPVEPFVPPKDTKADCYTLASVLAYLHRRAAIECTAEGRRFAALFRLMVSLSYAPCARQTWRTLVKVMLGRRVTG